MKNLIRYLVFFLCSTTLQAQVSEGLINTFDSGTEGWREGSRSPNPPTIFSMDGVNGENDPYLRNISTGGTGAGSKWILFNRSSAWTGNYNTASIIALNFDVRNTGPESIPLRFAAQNASEARAVTSDFIDVPADSTWRNVQLMIDPSAFTVVEGNGNSSQILSAVNEVRLVISEIPAWRGDVVMSTIDLDNLTLIALEDTTLSINCTVLNQASSIDTADGRVSLEVFGGATPYIADITGPAGTMPISVSAGTTVIDQLEAGDYTITVTDNTLDSEDCNFIITSPQDELFLNCTVVRNVSEIGGSDGIAEIVIEGGIEPFFVTQTYNNETSNLLLGQGATELPGLLPGEYEIRVEDDSGSIAMCTFFINQPQGSADRFIATLTSKSEVPPVTEFGSGEVEITVIDQTLTVSGFFSGLSSPVDTSLNGGTHIHLGYAGENGPVSIPLQANLSADRLSGSFFAGNNTFQLSPEQVVALRTRRMYINIHTEAYRSGEIRGQITPVSMLYFSSNLFGSYMSPNVMTEGFGGVFIELNGTQLIISGSFDDLEGDFNEQLGAQIRFGFPGQNGETVINTVVSPGPTPRSGVWVADNNVFELTAEQREHLRNRRLYITVNSLRFPGGEIRGQIVPNSSLALFRSYLNGMEQYPKVMTMADGFVMMEVTADNRYLAYGSFDGLSDTLLTDLNGGVHIHQSFPGRTGDVVVPISAQLDIDSVGYIMTPENNDIGLGGAVLNRLLNHELYVNVHSKAYPNGEIRGQLVPEANIIFGCPLSGILAIPENLSQAYGYMIGVLKGDQLYLSGSANQLSSALLSSNTGASLHLGLAGTSSNIEFNLAPTPDPSGFDVAFSPAINQFSFSQLQRLTLKGRAVYASLKTQNNQQEEVRGHFLQQGQLQFATTMTSSSSIPPRNSTGFGKLILEINDNQAYISGSITGLENGTISEATIKNGLPGRIGDTKITLSTSLDQLTEKLYNPSRNSFTVDDVFVSDLMDRSIYATIESPQNINGEIRGQLLPLATAQFSTLISNNEEQNQFGFGTVDLNGNRITVTGSIDSLHAIDSSTMLILYQGSIFEPGAIVEELIIQLDTQEFNLVAEADSNQFELPQVLIDELLSGNMFLQLRSDSIRSRFRGQLLSTENQYPSPSVIVAPEDGSLLEVNPDLDIAILIDWTQSQDENDVLYTYEISPDSTFGSMVYNLYSGPDHMFTTDMVILDSLLTVIGVDSGQTIKLFHRVLSTDGSLSSSGEPSCWILSRGMTTDVLDFLSEIQIQIYPNPTDEELTIEISEEFTPLNFRIINQLGQVVYQSSMGHLKKIPVRDWNPGLYYIKIGQYAFPWIKL